jgi:hypothetical protein
MFESPILQKMIAGALQRLLLALLEDRFGPVPQDVTDPLREILSESKLQQLILLAAKCADLQAFREAVLRITRRARAQRTPKVQGPSA